MSKKQRHQEKMVAAKKRDMRMLWNSNGWWTNSGYGTFQRDLLFRLVKEGWPVAQIAFYGIDGFPVYTNAKHADGTWFKDEWAGLDIKTYNKMDHPMGSDALIAHAADYKAHVAFTMQDIQLLLPEHLSKLRVWIPYVPIDKDPIPAGILENLKYAYKIITFSKFGQQALQKAGFVSTLIIEGTDTDIFKPMDKVQCRKDYGIPVDAFIFGMVAANKENPPRKGFQEAMDAFKLFHDKHPEAYLYVHTQQRTPGGFPVESYAQQLGFSKNLLLLNPYQAVFGSNSKNIVKEMNMFDVLLHPSQTEGFGLTCIEAMSCGVPVLVNNTTSMPELIIHGVTGEICETEKKGRYTSDLSFVYPADTQSLYEAMERIYTRLQKEPEKVAKDCRQHILDNYDINKIFVEKWIPFMEELQEELLPITSPLTTP